MNRKTVISLDTLLIILLLSFGTAYADETELKKQATYVLPLALQEIEEEAFSGVPVEIVIIPEGFLCIEEKAFNEAWHLTDVFIPDSANYIADSAFSITPNMTIHGIDGSYAKDWAYNHEIPFVVDNVWNVIVQNSRSHNSRTDPVNRYNGTIVLIIIFEIFRLGYYEVKSRRPQDRPELYPIDYRFP